MIKTKKDLIMVNVSSLSCTTIFYFSTNTSNTQDEHFDGDQKDIRNLINLYTTSVHKLWFKLCQIYRP